MSRGVPGSLVGVTVARDRRTATMTTGGAEPTPPDPPRPLTERERAALARLEAETRREDPEWFDLLARPSPRRGRRGRNLALQALVIVVLAVVLVPSGWLAGLLVVIVMLGPLAVAVWAMRRGVL
jgi:Protein of unknown function (DUF3040)